MESFLFNGLAFLLALGVLITVHELGHFWVARRLGVKVLRFSVGFGRPLWRRVGRVDGTEYVVAAVPLGGYVRMLDEREGEVPAAEAHRAFNRQSLLIRSAIVSAGPLFNFAFAILAYWLVFVTGDVGTRPIIGAVTAGSPAAVAGFRSGELVERVNGEKTPTWESVVYELLAAGVTAVPARVEVQGADGAPQVRLLATDSLLDLGEQRDALGSLGLAAERPTLAPVIGEVISGEPADRAGLRAGDRLVAVDGEPIADWASWVEYVQARPGKTLRVDLERAGLAMATEIVPAQVDRNGTQVGRIGAAVSLDSDPLEKYRAEVRYGPVKALGVAVQKTWDLSMLTLRVVWKMLIGEASVNNLSGPISIAQSAGQSASVGLIQFLKFLALVSVSLGVLNLLPVPVLDGGHLAYFAVEAIKGGPLSEAAQALGQRIGLALLIGLMALVLYLDLARLLA
jgi:regulator of sigma E protease